MAVFLDIYGNEARILIDAGDFGKAGKGTPQRGESPDPEEGCVKKATNKKAGKRMAVK